MADAADEAGARQISDRRPDVVVASRRLRGVFARYAAEPEGFADRYRDLLSRTGMASVAELGRDFGIDVADVAFWEGALGVTAERVDAYEGLVVAHRPQR